ncbi:MAG: plasmid pRiA4b ORF-3 family protein, partial [Nanoarchaeota archaeon]
MAKAIQFKVSLEGITPEIWRRFVVKDDITFHQLHEAIQAVMGWDNYHLYQFHVGDLCFEEPDPESSMNCK